MKSGLGSLKSARLRPWQSGAVLVLLSLFTVALVFFVSKEVFFDVPVREEMPPHFSVSVDPSQKIITPSPIVGELLTNDSEPDGRLLYISLLEKAAGTLARYGWYQSLASPSSRILVVVAGERREQVVDNFGDILKWSASEREQFSELVARSEPALSDGKFYPGHYLVHKNATPQDVANLVMIRFNEHVGERYTKEVADIVPIETALTIASLLEREAYDFEDMRMISGVIWNRLFIDMPLQLDATLQYARGSLPYGPWWPQVRPVDKFIESPFNTYEHKGLPPSPIANVRDDAVIAALNPIPTDCLFYFHDDDGVFSCTETYEAHVENLKRKYGQGR